MPESQSSRPTQYEQVLSELARHKVDFVICGGLACALHGSTRNTRDIDLYVRLENENLHRLVNAAKALRLQPRVPEPLESLANEEKRAEWIQKKNAVVFTLVSNESPLQVDIFLAYPIPYDEVSRKADEITMENQTFRISSKHHLIQAKQTVQPIRIEDEFDIKFLKEQIARESQQRPKAK